MCSSLREYISCSLSFVPEDAPEAPEVGFKGSQISGVCEGKREGWLVAKEDNDDKVRGDQRRE